MKAQFLNRSVGTDCSIALEEHGGKFFKKLWHYHPELEIMLIQEGTGSIFVGDNITKFEPGTLVIIGKNLPHLWQNDKNYFADESQLAVSGITIHFNEGFAGSLLEIPEMSSLRNLLTRASRGIEFLGEANSAIRNRIKKMFELSGYEQIMCFLEILHMLSIHPKYRSLSSLGYMDSFKEIRDSKILPVYEYVMNNFKDNITLNTVAGIANMNASAFSRYFASAQKKTFTQFVNEIRIGYACKLLIDGQHNVSEACFESGFNNLSNFNRQFLSIKHMSPSTYVKMHVIR